MIAEAKKTGLPDYSPPKEQRDARRFLLNQCDGGAMGPVIQEISVQNSEAEPITLPATNFLTYLQALFFRGGGFHQLLASKRNQNPSSTSKPWSTWTSWCLEMCWAGQRGRAGHGMPVSSNLASASIPQTVGSP